MLPSFVDVEVTTNELGRFRHPLEHGEGPGLVERFVQVPALGALHAGRAAEQTRAAAEQLSRVRDPALECLEAALRDPDTARVAVVDEDRRGSRLEVHVRREAADIPPVA